VQLLLDSGGQLGERGVVVLLDHRAQVCTPGLVQAGGRAPAVGPRQHVAVLAVQRHHVGDEV
jgi:hypothetical protein